MKPEDQARIVFRIYALMDAQNYFDEVNIACSLYPTGNMRRDVHTMDNRRWEAYNALLRAIGIEDIEDFYKRDCNGNLY